MQIKLMASAGLQEALFGIGLSYGVTSGWDGPLELPHDKTKKLKEIAARLCKAGAGEDKFLRQVVCWWDVTAPRYWWAEADTFKVGTVAQSESTMHTITRRTLNALVDFEEPVDGDVLNRLNDHIRWYNETKGDAEEFMAIKNMLPEGFLQRRIWMLNLANMKNIHAQRRHHRLPQWQTVCKAFYDATPDFLRGMYGGQA